MQTTSGLLIYLRQRLGALGLSVLLVLALAVAVFAALAFVALSEALAASADPIQLAPVRWMRRF